MTYLLYKVRAFIHGHKYTCCSDIKKRCSKCLEERREELINGTQNIERCENCLWGKQEQGMEHIKCTRYGGCKYIQLPDDCVGYIWSKAWRKN